MIIRSYKKQKGKNMLIFIQLFISSFCLAVGIGFFEINISHISKVKSIIGTDIIYTVINTTPPFRNVNESDNAYIKEFYKDIKKDGRVESIGTYDLGYISTKNNLDRPYNLYKDRQVIIMDNSFFNMLHNKAEIYKVEKENNMKLNMAFGNNISYLLKKEEELNVHVPTSNKNYSVIASAMVDKNIYFLSTSTRGCITENISSTENMMFVLLPKSEKPLCSDKYFIKLNNNVDSEKFIKDIDDLGKKYGLESYTHDIKYEIDKYINDNKIPMMATITLSIILLILSSIGLVGVILSSILRRKKEFGIRYSLGCTPNELLKLIVGEIMLLFIMSTFAGITFSYIISLFIDNMKIGLLTIILCSGTMFLFCFLSSVIPARKIIRMDPITLINEGRD